MTLWLLTRLREAPSAEWMDWTDRLIVRASDETMARLLAAMHASEKKSEEGAATWTDPEASTCVELAADGREEVVLADRREITPYY